MVRVMLAQNHGVCFLVTPLDPPLPPPHHFSTLAIGFSRCTKKTTPLPFTPLFAHLPKVPSSSNYPVPVVRTVEPAFQSTEFTQFTQTTQFPQSAQLSQFPKVPSSHKLLTTHSSSCHPKYPVPLVHTVPPPQSTEFLPFT